MISAEEMKWAMPKYSVSNQQALENLEKYMVDAAKESYGGICIGLSDTLDLYGEASIGYEYSANYLVQELTTAGYTVTQLERELYQISWDTDGLVLKKKTVMEHTDILNDLY